MTDKARGELGVVLAFVALTSAFFIGKPIHMDEPLFLAPARHIVADPLHPFDFEFNWYGRSAPMSSINNTPPLMLYALAAAWKVSEGREWLMRLFFVSANNLAAVSLYLLAGVFLSEPLWPVLVLLVSPAYMINMNLLYPETLALALGFLGLYALVRSVRERRDRFFWTSALYVGLAVFAKYGAVFLIPTASWYAYKEKVPLRKVATYAVLSAVPIALYLVYDRLTYHAAVGTVWTALAQGVAMPYGGWAHRLRSFLSFIGGGALAAAFWPLAGARSKAWPWLAAPLFCLFLPVFDALPLVRLVDRLTGFGLSFGAAAALWAAWETKGRGRSLWLPWIISALFVQVFLYWSVIARVVLFMLPALVFCLAGELEDKLSGPRLKRLYVLSFVLTAALTAVLAAVDDHYATAQKAMAESVAHRFPDRRLWCDGHWGLQFYMERAGARELDTARGGWDEVRAGDVVVVPLANSNILRPSRKILSNVSFVAVPEPLPLRLISAVSGEGGFYSSATGFLPFSFSVEPLERFEIVEVLP